MPRKTVVWEARVHEIRKSVENSVRSHYTRKELQLLFQVQARTAGELMACFPQRGAVGSSHVVSKTELLKFFKRVMDTSDVPALMRTMKLERDKPSRKKLRSLVLRDEMPTSLEGLPSSIKLERGVVTLNWVTIEELTRDLLYFGNILHEQLDTFCELYEPPRDKTAEEQSTDRLRALFTQWRQEDPSLRFELLEEA